MGSDDRQHALWEGVEEAELLEEGDVDGKCNFLAEALWQLSHNLHLLPSISAIQPVLHKYFLRETYLVVRIVVSKTLCPTFYCLISRGKEWYGCISPPHQGTFKQALAK